MSQPNEVLSQLIRLSRHLGDPVYDYAIIGEGNTSARADTHSFWVKASGAELRTIDADGFVQVRFEPILNLLKGGSSSDAEVKTGLEAARSDPTATRRPSVETFLHAIALQLEGINFVGHTHPTVVNAVLCSRCAEEAISGRLFPDEIVVCGPAPAYVPYVDPGLPLARAVHRAIDAYGSKYGQAPKVILMQNHGLIALGKSAVEVQNITAMYVKTARVILGAYALGGPHFMTPEQVERIYSRPDEHYRQKMWGNQ
jgi:rhamnose utilization protein RhaD (predicted bifunctional aldolase and dehydrogenase)